MSRTVCMILALTLLLGCVSLSETALTVNGTPVSREECGAFMLCVTDTYADVCEYYESSLDCDLWSLTYPNGLTVWESVKADAFEQLVMMNVFAEMADSLSVSVSADERAACAADAHARIAQGGASDVSENALAALYEKRLLADKVYALLLSGTDVDEQAVADTLDPADYETSVCEYLCVPYYVYADDAEVEREMCELLRTVSRFKGKYEDAANYFDYVLAGTLSVSDTEDGFAEAVQDLDAGECSDVIKTNFGLFVLRLSARGTDLYQAALGEALYNARKAAYVAEYERLYASAEYELDVSYWSELNPYTK